MKLKALTLATAAILAAAPLAAAAQDPVRPGRESGLGVTGPETPELLARIQADPYAPPREPGCAGVAAELTELDTILGPDVDTPREEKTSVGEGVGGAIKSLIPYRGVVRFVTGAALHVHHAMADIRRLNREEAHISQSLAENGVRVLYTFDLAPALQFRDQGLRIYNFYDPHMPLPRPGAHVLSRFPDGLDQWAGLAPARNWARIQDSCKLLELYTFGATNWTLYETR